MLADGSQVSGLDPRARELLFDQGDRFGAHIASSTYSILLSKSPRLTSLSLRSNKANQRPRSRESDNMIWSPR